jgi:hypothetical protein
MFEIFLSLIFLFVGLYIKNKHPLRENALQNQTVCGAWEVTCIHSKTRTKHTNQLDGRVHTL